MAYIHRLNKHSTTEQQSGWKKHNLLEFGKIRRNEMTKLTF